MAMGVTAEGIPFCPEAAACIGALGRLKSEGFIGNSDRVVIFNTAAAQKYLDIVPSQLPRLNKDEPIDWDSLKAGKF